MPFSPTPATLALRGFAMNWFYSKDGQPAGPVDDEEFERLIGTGAITGATLVWHSGLADWKPYTEVRPAGAPPPLLRVADATPAAEAVLEAAVPPPDDALAPHSATDMRYAGFWIRVVATVFDSLILLPILSLIYIGFFVHFPDFLTGLPASNYTLNLYEAACLTVVACYETLFVGRFGATPGKLICNLRILQSDGRPISYSLALGRYFCKCLSWSLFIVYILVALNRQKCGFHDLICDTRVIHTD